MRMSRAVINVSILPLLRKERLSVNKRWFRTYVEDVLRSVGGCYVGYDPPDRDIKHPGVPTERFEARSL